MSKILRPGSLPRVGRTPFGPKPVIAFSYPHVLRYRSFHESANKQSTALGNLNVSQPTPATAGTPLAASKGLTITNRTEYLKAFTTSELFSFLIIGFATLNKPILNLCIKLFPYVPMPIIKALVYKIYCGGETIDQVKKTGERLSQRGIHNMMISLTIEACNGNDNIDPSYIVEETSKSINNILIPHTLKMIKESGKGINAIPAGYVALKPTGFVKDAANVLKNFDQPQYSQQFDDLVSKAETVCQTIYNANQKLAVEYPDRIAPFVVGVIDAEKYDLQEGVYELQRRLYKKFNHVNKPVSIVGTLQMYLSDSSNLLAREENLAKENNYRLGLKLVRGAYIHSEKSRSTIIHKSKEDTDLNYNQGISYCIENILGEDATSVNNQSTIGHLVVASHNGDSLQLATEKLNGENPNKNNVCLGQLLGMADNITHNLIETYNVDNIIKYVAWGPPLETKEYLLRRLEENGDAVKNDNGWPLIKATATILSKRLFGLA